MPQNKITAANAIRGIVRILLSPFTVFQVRSQSQRTGSTHLAAPPEAPSHRCFATSRDETSWEAFKADVRNTGRPETFEGLYWGPLEKAELRFGKT